MPNFLQLWRGGLAQAVIKLCMCLRLGYTPPTIRQFGNARRDQATIVSKDEDFVDRWLMSDQPVPLVWIRKGNCSNQALVEWLEPMWSDVVARLGQGEALIELRS